MAVNVKSLVSRVIGRFGRMIGGQRADDGWVPAARRSVDMAMYERISADWRERGARIGRNVRITGDLDMVNPHLITIGDNCVIGGAVLVHGPRRRLEPSVIGSNVYMGRGAIVLSGVSVGDNCIIGAGAVVTRDMPPNAIVAGNPARIVGQRDPDEVTQFVADMERGAYIGAQVPGDGNPG